MYKAFDVVDTITCSLYWFDQGFWVWWRFFIEIPYQRMFFERQSVLNYVSQVLNGCDALCSTGRCIFVTISISFLVYFEKGKETVEILEEVGV